MGIATEKLAKVHWGFAGLRPPDAAPVGAKMPLGKCGWGPARPLLRDAGHLASKKHLGEGPTKEGEKEPLCQTGIVAVIPWSPLGTLPGESLPGEGQEAAEGATLRVKAESSRGTGGP